MKKFCINAAVLLCSLCLALGLVELFLRLTYFVDFADRSANYAFYRFDPLLGWANTPQASGIFSKQDFSVEVRNNSLGMRDKARQPAEPGKRRIAVLGDSFTWGYGVNAEDRYTDIVEKKLSPDVEMLNFGVSGYGPVQYLLQVDQILAFKPEIVVLAFCLENDFRDNVVWQRYGYYGPYGLNDHGTLAIAGYPLPQSQRFGRHFSDTELARFLRSHSKIYSLLLGTLNSKYQGQQAGLADFDYSDIYKPESPHRAEALAINALILQAIQEKLAQQGVPLLLLAVPSKDDLSPVHNKFRPEAAREALVQTADSLGIDWLDPSPALNLDDFFAHDSHWNRAGHQKVAAVLQARLEALLRGAGTSPAPQASPAY